MSPRQTVRVGLGERSYDILVGAGLIGETGALLAPALARPRAIVVTDANVASLHLDRLSASLAAAGIAASSVVLPPGEATKDWAHLESLIDRLLGSKPKEMAKTAVKCDVCASLKGGPACVRACPTGAALRVSPENFLSLSLLERGRD